MLGYGLCPWADGVLRQGRVRRQVVTDAAPAADAALSFIDALEREGATADARENAADIGFVIYPRLNLDGAAFDSYVERVRRADRARRPAGQPPAFLMASFHPFGAEQFGNPFQLVSFIRRTPDPTIQLVRAALLDRVRAGQADVSDQVARHNFATVRERGSAGLDTLLRELRQDRDVRYQALGIR